MEDDGLDVLKHKIKKIINTLNSLEMANLSWKETMAKLSVLVSQYISLESSIDESLSHTSIIPIKTLPGNDIDYISRIFLRTKLIPDIEKERRDVLLEQMSDLAKSPKDLAEMDTYDINQTVSEFSFKIKKFDDAFKTLLDAISPAAK